MEEPGWKPPRGPCPAGFASGATSKLPAVAVCTVRRYCSYVLVRSWPPAVLPTLGRLAQQAQAAQARGPSVLPMLAMPALRQASVHACLHAAFACPSGGPQPWMRSSTAVGLGRTDPGPPACAWTEMAILQTRQLRLALPRPLTALHDCLPCKPCLPCCDPCAAAT